ncbi:hypothetical protein D5S19_02305 [Amycolatopsis panacis]|uniref:Uncharacterized protein n=1 Tax=Amycolatopsis panacis TaxID=2340917 RepID=A0A419IAP7_9PSEU|nr:hypothetical protein D5S19_02305 [Amycolatopsis panacis]
MLPEEVVERIIEVLAERGKKVLACLRTADAFLRQAAEDDAGLRYAESAGYNIREALDAVVEDSEAVRDGVPSALDAWNRYLGSLGSSPEARDAAWRPLEIEMSRLGKRRNSASSRASKLIGFLRRRTGVDALPGGADPVTEYKKLHDESSKAVHGDAALATATDLFDRAVAWFVRIFAPPESIIQAIRKLAREPYRSLEQLDRLQQIAYDEHHLRLFFAAVTDPAWLPAMLQRGLITLPEANGLWPVAALIDGLGQSHAPEVATVLEDLGGRVKTLPQGLRIPAAFELLRVALHIGPHGHGVAGTIVESYFQERNIIGLAVEVVRQAAPEAPVVKRIADVAIGTEPFDNNYYRNTVLLKQLAAGLTLDNAKTRIELLAAKLARLITPANLTLPLDTARLTAELDEHPRIADNMAHHLARMLHRARELGVPTDDLLSWIRKVPDEAGDRLASSVLTLADDIPLGNKIAHITRRLAAPVPTGDDQDLIEAIHAAAPPPEKLVEWTDTLGTPPEPTGDDSSRPPEDWYRVWRWSPLLPSEALAAWAEPIAEVTRHVGEPGTSHLGHRSPRSWSTKEESPYSADELASYPPLEAARTIAAWRPGTSDRWQLTSARVLARTLEQTIASDPQPWAADAVNVVEALREPIYVLHYFRALADNAQTVSTHTSAVLLAAARARSARWEPVALGSDNYEFEPDWHNVDATSVDLAANLARCDGNLAESLDGVWTWATTPIELAPDAEPEHPYDEMTDALFHAINSARGCGLRATIWLARWELRNVGAIRPQFEALLTATLGVPGAAGSEYRAILAQYRPVLENSVPEWCDANLSQLFGQDALGRNALAMTLKYSQPTASFFARFCQTLVTAARRGLPHADAWLALALVDEVYPFDTIIRSLRGDADAVQALGNQIAFHGQHVAEDSREMASALSLWRQLIAADRRLVPGVALRSSGRWSLVTAIPDSIWAELTLASLRITAGKVDLVIEVADRCATAEVTEATLELFRLLLENDIPWERGHVALRARATLTANPCALNSTDGRALDRRLTELGFPAPPDDAA